MATVTSESRGINGIRVFVVFGRIPNVLVFAVVFG